MNYQDLKNGLKPLMIFTGEEYGLKQYYLKRFNYIQVDEEYVKNTINSIFPITKTHVYINGLIDIELALKASEIYNIVLVVEKIQKDLKRFEVTFPKLIQPELKRFIEKIHPNLKRFIGSVDNVNDVENLAYFVANDFDTDFLYIGGKPEQINNVAKLYKLYYNTKNVNYYNILVKGLQGKIILNNL